MRPNTGIIADEQTGDTGLNIREGIYARTVMEVGEPKDLGLLLSAAMYAIYKRGDIGDWAEFIEIFGRGIIDATWDGFDESQRVQLSEALHSMGGGGIIIRPDGTNIDIKQNTGSANGALQEGFARILDEWIAKVLLGSTETSGASKSSGYAQGVVHQEEDVKKNESDINFVRRYLNSQFIKCLIAAGFPVHGGTFIIKSVKKVNKEKYEIHKSMALDLKLPIDDDFFYEEYGMPKPKNYDALKAEIKQKEELVNAHTPNATEEKEPDNLEKKSKKDQDTEVKMSDRSWIKRAITALTTLSFFVAAPTASGAMINTGCCGNHHTTLSLPASNLNDEQLIQRYWDAGGNLAFDIGSFNNTSTVLLSGLKKGWNTGDVNLVDLGFDYGYNDPAVMTAFEMNLFRFSAAKTLAEAQKLNQLFRSAPDFATYYINAKNALDVFNRQWLETEYTTAQLTGESAATYTRLKSKLDKFPYWMYKTVGDMKVREAHVELNGLILPANHPAWKKLFPPNGWRCRCYVVGRLEFEVSGVDFAEMETRANNYFMSADFKNSEKHGFGINRAETGEVFTKNQMYIQELEGKAAAALNQLTHKMYQLKDFEQAKLVAKDDIPEGGEVSPGEILKDYHNRTFIIPEEVLNNSVNKYLTAVKRSLNSPDEVWINGAKYDSFITIKYFKDSTVIIKSNIRNGQIYQVENWTTTNKGADVDKYRIGLLIYSKS